MAEPIDPNNADDKAAKIAALQAKMAEAKAKRLAAESGASTPDAAELIAGNPNAGSKTTAAPPLSEVPTSSAATAQSQGGKPVGAVDDAHAAATPGASAPPPPTPTLAIPPGTDPEKAAKIAELQAKMAAAKAKTLATASPTSVTGSAPTPAAAKAAPATTAAIAGNDSGADARIASMRTKISETKVAAPTRKIVRQAPPKNDSEIGVWYFGRRSFLQSIGWMSFFGFLTIVILGAVRAMFPRVIYERPPVFKAGFPNDYVPGTVSEQYKAEERVWIIRQTDGSFIALLAICTHLGCTPRWLTSENKFKCPCHGSGFRGNPSWGINFEGPAPRPLERLAIHLAPDGQIEIDKSKKFLYEKNQWEDPAATLKA